MKFHKDNTDNLLTAKMVKESRKRIEKAREIGEAKRKVDEETAIIQEKRKKRTDAYPSIGAQLDMLWHDINDGNISANTDYLGGWYAEIKRIKKTNPL